jgi:hypothetical protein
VKTQGEDVVRGVVEGDWVAFASGSGSTAREGEKVGDSVQVSLDVLGGEAAVGLEDQEGYVSRDSQVSGVCCPLDLEARRVVEPADRRRIVSKGKDTVVGVGCEAL